MHFTDTHAHIYLPEFDHDRDAMISRALASGVKNILLPNIDLESVEPLLSLSLKYPGICYPMMGLHPTSVRDDYLKKIEIIEGLLRKGSFIAVGEIGIDLYWDKTFIKEQVETFAYQLNLAIELGLPVVIHCRNSFDAIFEVLEGFKGRGLKGVFHSFTGDIMQAEKAIAMGFHLGIGGIVTFKNSGLDRVVSAVGITSLLLETDSPYLAPSPHRGKRNESAYIVNTARRISEVTAISMDEVASVTTANANKLFNIR